MTNKPGSLASPDTLNTGSKPAKLDPSAGYITIINTYVVAPERAEALLNLLLRATVETIRYVPGFVSANFHINLDRTQVVNYAQWRSREANRRRRRRPQGCGAHP